MCLDEECSCKPAHVEHSMCMVEGFMKKVQNFCKPTKEQLQFEQALLQITEKMHQQIDEIQRRYIRHAKELARNNSSYGVLLEELAMSQAPSESLTGHKIMRVMEEIQSDGIDGRPFSGLIEELSSTY